MELKVLACIECIARRPVVTVICGIIGGMAYGYLGSIGSSAAGEENFAALVGGVAGFIGSVLIWGSAFYLRFRLNASNGELSDNRPRTPVEWIVPPQVIESAKASTQSPLAALNAIKKILGICSVLMLLCAIPLLLSGNPSLVVSGVSGLVSAGACLLFRLAIDNKSKRFEQENQATPQAELNTWSSVTSPKATRQTLFSFLKVLRKLLVVLLFLQPTACALLYLTFDPQTSDARILDWVTLGVASSIVYLLLVAIIDRSLSALNADAP